MYNSIGLVCKSLCGTLPCTEETEQKGKINQIAVSDIPIQTRSLIFPAKVFETRLASCIALRSHVHINIVLKSCSQYSYFELCSSVDGSQKLL